MIDMLVGAIAMGSAVVALFFLRFWRNSRDRFFLYFAVSFFLEAVNRVYMDLTGAVHESSPEHYVIRLISYGLILWAIIEKNWPQRK